MPLTPRDRRTLMIGGGVLAFLLVGFFLFNTLGGGEEALPPIPTISVSPGGGGGESPTTTPTITISPVPVFTGRDPFSIPPGLQVTASTSISPVSPTSPTSPVSPTSPTSPTSPPPSTPGGGSSVVLGGKTVVLLDTFPTATGKKAQFEVNGKVEVVGIGETFGGGDFKLTSISDGCATFLFGDESHTLCANVTK